MNRVSVDMATISKLNAAAGLVEVCDESGKTCGIYHPLPGRAISSPFSREEIERRRKNPSGRSLRQILAELEPS